MNLLAKVTSVIVLSAGFLLAQQENAFSTRGSKWLGGGVSFASAGEEGYHTRILQVSPMLRFFPADHFMIGPSFSWTGIFSSYDSDYYHAQSSYNQLGLGLEIGGVFNAGGHIYPYIISGGQVIITGGDGSSSTGFSLPVTGGILVPLGNVFGLQIEPSFINLWA